MGTRTSPQASRCAPSAHDGFIAFERDRNEINADLVFGPQLLGLPLFAPVSAGVSESDGQAGGGEGDSEEGAVSGPRCAIWLEVGNMARNCR